MRDIELGKEEGRLTGEITDGTVICQTFHAIEDNLSAVEVYFGTYCRTNRGEMHCGIVDHKNKIVAEAKVNMSELSDNNYHTFSVNADLIAGRTYELRLYTVNGRAGYTVTSKCGKRRGGHLFIGSRLMGSEELSCVFQYKDNQDIENEERRKDGEITIGGLVSVVIPHYNCPDYLTKTLISLHKQSYKGIEIIIVDDGSESPSQVSHILNTLKPLIGNVTFYRNDRNKGAPAARNTGYSLAKGEYVLFADADCEFYPYSIEVYLRTLMENPKAAYSYGGFIWGPDRILPKQFDLEYLQHHNFITTMSMIRHHLFAGFDEELKRHQDWDLWLTMASQGNYGVCTNTFMFESAVRPNGISSGKTIGMMESRDIVKRKHGLI